MNKKLLFIGGAIVLVALLAAIYFRLNKPSTGAVVDVVPGDAIITIDGNKQISKGLAGLSPGEHTIRVSRRGFEASESSFTVTDGRLTTVNIALKATSDEGRKWLEDNPGEVFKAEGFAGQEVDRTGAETTQKNPLIEQLPFIDREYRVDYGPSQKNPDDETAVTIYIRYSSLQGREQALEWIRLQGVDPASLEIIYGEITGF